MTILPQAPLQTQIIPSMPVVTAYWGQWLNKLVMVVNILVGNVGQVQANGAYPIALTPVLFADLSALATAGTITAISDSTTAVWGGVIAGGGANQVLAWYNGANWVVIGA